MTRDSEYWTQSGPTTMSRIVELANWLERHLNKNNGYSRTYIESACAEFDNHPGAFTALLSAGYVYPDRSYIESGVWRIKKTFIEKNRQSLSCSLSSTT